MTLVDFIVQWLTTTRLNKFWEVDRQDNVLLYKGQDCHPRPHFLIKGLEVRLCCGAKSLELSASDPAFFIKLKEELDNQQKMNVLKEEEDAKCQ